MASRSRGIRSCRVAGTAVLANSIGNGRSRPSGPIATKLWLAAIALLDQAGSLTSHAPDGSASRARVVRPNGPSSRPPRELGTLLVSGHDASFDRPVRPRLLRSCRWFRLAGGRPMSGSCGTGSGSRARGPARSAPHSMPSGGCGCETSSSVRRGLAGGARGRPSPVPRGSERCRSTTSSSSGFPSAPRPVKASVTQACTACRPLNWSLIPAATAAVAVAPTPWPARFRRRAARDGTRRPGRGSADPIWSAT